MSMRRGAGSGILGTRTSRTPFVRRAATPSGSTGEGNSKLRLKSLAPRSRRKERLASSSGNVLEPEMVSRLSSRVISNCSLSTPGTSARARSLNQSRRDREEWTLAQASREVSQVPECPTESSVQVAVKFGSAYQHGILLPALDTGLPSADPHPSPTRPAS